MLTTAQTTITTATPAATTTTTTATATTTTTANVDKNSETLLVDIRLVKPVVKETPSVALDFSETNKIVKRKSRVV